MKRQEQVTAYVDSVLKRRLERAAREQHRAVSTLAGIILAEWLDARDARSRAPESVTGPTPTPEGVIP